MAMVDAYRRIRRIVTAALKSDKSTSGCPDSCRTTSEGNSGQTKRLCWRHRSLDCAYICPASLSIVLNDCYIVNCWITGPGPSNGGLAFKCDTLRNFQTRSPAKCAGRNCYNIAVRRRVDARLNTRL